MRRQRTGPGNIGMETVLLIALYGVTLGLLWKH
jgi:hypothetical protein